MSKTIDTSKRLTEDDLRYLAARDQLTPELMKKNGLSDADVNRLNRGGLYDPLGAPHTGTVNTMGLTQEELDLIQEHRRQQAEEQDGFGERAFRPTEGRAQAEREVADDYETLNVDTLRELLVERDLDTSGKKAELIARLRESDEVDGDEVDDGDDDDGN